MAVIYGFAGASSNTKDLLNDERVIGAALRRALMFKDAPYFLGVGFNINSKASKVISLAKAAEWVTDLAENWAAPGQEPGPTYRFGAVDKQMQDSGTTRIDTVLANGIVNIS